MTAAQRPLTLPAAPDGSAGYTITLGAGHSPAPQSRTTVSQDLAKLARSILLAFADLGIYLPSERERLVGKSRRLNPTDRAAVSEFVEMCIDADLIAPDEADRLHLNPEEARRLAHSLDGHTPVPDEQAAAWARILDQPAV